MGAERGARPMSRVTVALLGGFRVQMGSGDPLSVPTKKAQALLAYLAIRPGQAHPRDKLAALLWPDMSDGQARQNLRQALTALRRILPSGRPPILHAEGETLAVDATGLSVDVVEFERHLARGTPDSLARATQL